MPHHDLLSAEAVTTGLKTRRIGHPTYVFKEITSTNSWLMAQAAQGEAEGAVALADVQTAGKGRLGRTWQSPPGAGLLFSILFRPKSPATAGQAMMVVATGVVAGIAEVTGLSPRLKWPNDVLLGGRKVAGLLAEATTDPASGQTDVVVGVGLNVNLRAEDFPPPPAGGTPATSLLAALGRPVDRVSLLRAILAATEIRYDAVLTGASPLPIWRGLLETLGQRVRVVGGEAPVEGIAEDVGPDGSLLVRTAEGDLVTIAAGEVSLRAPKGGA